MKIGLWSLEHKVVNTALMQISQYHKEKGDEVSWYSPLFKYDKVYVSSIFTFTKKPKLKPNMVAGGTGFDATIKLPREIEESNFDYSIYPKNKKSFVWFSRGCVNHCPFCIVSKKEGSLSYSAPKNLNPNGNLIVVMDNSFTALPNPMGLAAVDWLADQKQTVDFQGIDVRIPNIDLWHYMKDNLKMSKYIHVAWDNPREDLTENLLRFIEVFGKSRIMVYVLIGFWSTPAQDLYRVKMIRALGLDAWVMPYNKKDLYQFAFERWCNRHINCKWEEYSYGAWNRK